MNDQEMQAKAWLTDPTRVVRHNTNEMVTVVAIPRDHYVDFYLYPIAAHDVILGPSGLIGTDDTVGKIYYQRDGATSGGDRVTDLAEAEMFMYGDIRASGCSDWIFVEAPAIHCCSRKDIMQFGEWPAMCWNLMNELCPHWDEINDEEIPTRRSTLKEMYPNISDDKLDAVHQLLTAFADTDQEGSLIKLAAVEAMVTLQDMVGLTTHRVDLKIGEVSSCHWPSGHNGVSLTAFTTAPHALVMVNAKAIFPGDDPNGEPPKPH
jgi:hypothetical protein